MIFFFSFLSWIENSEAFVFNQQNWILFMKYFFQKDNQDHVTAGTTLG